MTESSVIQSYLASFNKEIECDDLETDNELESEAERSKEIYSSSENEINDGNMDEIKIKSEDEDPGFYYETPHLKLRQNKGLSPSKRKAAEIIRLGVKKENESASLSDTAVSDIEEIHLDDQQTLEMVAHLAEEAANHDMMNDLGAYQTVTVVPSDTNPGELSYVLFVSEDGNCLDPDGNNVNLALYNFSGNESFDKSFLAKQAKPTARFTGRRQGMGRQLHMCSYCDYSSSKRYLLARHMKSHSDDRPHKCGVCDRGFKTLASLQNHVNTHTGTRPHSCKECESCFTTSGELVRHIRYKHTHEKPHKCTECDYASVELSKLKRHMRCHTGERPYQCPHCTYASPDTYKLKRHLRIHTGEKPYECDICQARFTQSNSLKAHKLIHSGNKPVFHCEYCPATCGRKTDLRIHMEKLHSSNKPHRCSRCSKVFLDRYSYKIHIKSHEGEKCYKCDLCDYASISPRHLETHMFVHTDQKPFNCDECDQSFRQKQLLKRHKNLYHDPSYVPPEPKEKPHVCILCSKAFRHRGNLIRHFALHDPEASVSDKEAARLEDLKTEDEEFDEEECVNDTKTEDEQVVVFEVIQLPSTNKVSEEPVTMIDGNTFFLNNGDGLSYSVIEPADDSVNNFLPFESCISDSEDVENISILCSDNKNVENQKNVTSYGSRKRIKSLLGNKSARKSTFKKPSILKACSDKERIKGSSIPTLAQDEMLMLQKEKEIEQAKELLEENDFESFGFNDKEGGILSIVGANYSSPSSSLVPDIS